MPRGLACSEISRFLSSGSHPERVCVGKGESGGGKVLAGGFITLTKKVTCSVEVTRKRKRNWSSYAYAEVSYA